MVAPRKPVTWRSGLEDKTGRDLTDRGVSFRYEEVKLAFERPASRHTYCPDFILPNGIIIETKGIFSLEDRQKHELIQSQHPRLDIRFVFSRSKSPLRKGAKSTYADWCLKHNFHFHDKTIPQAWIDEPVVPERLEAIDRATHRKV